MTVKPRCVSASKSTSKVVIVADSCVKSIMLFSGSFIDVDGRVHLSDLLYIYGVLDGRITRLSWLDLNGYSRGRHIVATSTSCQLRFCLGPEHHGMAQSEINAIA